MVAESEGSPTSTTGTHYSREWTGKRRRVVGGSPMWLQILHSKLVSISVTIARVCVCAVRVGSSPGSASSLRATDKMNWDKLPETTVGPLSRDYLFSIPCPEPTFTKPRAERVLH